MGRFDADGDLFLTGRTAELIISGGVNIYPVEIDEILIRHPDIADAAVVGVPNEDWGEEIKAVVELKPGVSRSAETTQSILDCGKTASRRVRSTCRYAAAQCRRQGVACAVRAPYWARRSKSI
jgi:long-chain acyl-CoA synthetase